MVKIMIGTQLHDEALMKDALKEFKAKAKKKFLNGIKEHNPDGDKGMVMMSMKDRVSCAKDEVIDLWFYLHAIEQGVKQTRNEFIKMGKLPAKTWEEHNIQIQGVLERGLNNDE